MSQLTLYTCKKIFTGLYMTSWAIHYHIISTDTKAIKRN